MHFIIVFKSAFLEGVTFQTQDGAKSFCEGTILSLSTFAFVLLLFL